MMALSRNQVHESFKPKMKIKYHDTTKKYVQNANKRAGKTTHKWGFDIDKKKEEYKMMEGKDF